jgi:hypothetical protein
MFSLIILGLLTPFEEVTTLKALLEVVESLGLGLNLLGVDACIPLSGDAATHTFDKFLWLEMFPSSLQVG